MRSLLKPLVIAALVALAACTPRTGPPGPPPAAKPLTITYETEPCYGPCPVYAVTVSADGKGHFQGRQFTAFQGDRDFTVTPAQFAAFADALAPWRPVGRRDIMGGSPGCPHLITDLPGVKVGWTGGGKPDGALSFDYGCGQTAPTGLPDALGDAPEKLPIAALVGEQP